MNNKKGILIILSAPAGSGKSTVRSKLCEWDGENTVYSVSATTRAPRPGEKDGIDYSFKSRDEFERLIDSDALLEYAEYAGNYYGTPAHSVEEALEAGKNVILEIEVVGAMKVKNRCPDALMILLLAPNYKTQEARLRGRGTDSEESIQKRLSVVRYELDHFDNYDYVVINRDGEPEKAAREIYDIINVRNLETSRNRELKEKYFAC